MSPQAQISTEIRSALKDTRPGVERGWKRSVVVLNEIEQIIGSQIHTSVGVCSKQHQRQDVGEGAKENMYGLATFCAENKISDKMHF